MILCRFLEPFNFNFHKAMRMWDKEEMRGSYTVQLKVAGQEFVGFADLPQQAKHVAAEKVLEKAHFILHRIFNYSILRPFRSSRAFPTPPT